MEQISKNPGLTHIAENIFLNLDLKNLDKCKGVCKSWKKILNTTPKILNHRNKKLLEFWFKECIKRNLFSKQNDSKVPDYQSDWKNAIQMAKIANFEEKIIDLFELAIRIQMPIYVTPIQWAIENEYKDIVKFLNQNTLLDTLPECMEKVKISESMTMSKDSN